MKNQTYSNPVIELALPVSIQANISLKDKNWFNTGGQARYFSQPRNAHEFQQALLWAQRTSLPVFILGQGANILISDDGFDGLVIQPCLEDWSITVPTNKPLVKVGAGISMHALITRCLDENIIGLEEFSGIPGTVGGSIYINLHYFEFLLEQFLIEATIINKHTLALEKVDKSWFNFSYNSSKLQEGDHYVLDATFALTYATDLQVAYARGRHVEIIRHREKRYPLKNTCGSFFRNFYEHEVTLITSSKKIIYVAYYLDKLGIKGELRYGGAIVSYQHANMIVNDGTATTENIIGLARMMQELVHKQYNLIPQPECRLVGFKEYPLL